MQLDHVVLWVDDPARALAFYAGVLGLEPVRKREYENGGALFPSVRVSATTIIDLMGKKLLPAVREATGAGEDSGAPLNHLCLSMDRAAYDAVASRLAERGLQLTPGGSSSFGAQGVAADSAYFCDPDGNVIEIRCYP